MAPINSGEEDYVGRTDCSWHSEVTGFLLTKPTVQSDIRTLQTNISLSFMTFTSKMVSSYKTEENIFTFTREES